MAYDPDIPPSLLMQGVGGGEGLRFFVHTWVDPIEDVLEPGYVTNAATLGMRAGDTYRYKDTNRGEWDHYDLIVASIDDSGAATVAFPELPPEAIPEIEEGDEEDLELVGFVNGRQYRAPLSVIPGILTDGDKGDIIVSDGGSTLTLSDEAQASLAKADTAVQPGSLPFIMVTDEAFGALGDGVTDDGPAIQTALDSLEATGGICFVPSGEFFTEQQINVPSNVWFRGVGWQSVILASDELADTEHVITNKKNNRASRTDYDENIRISDMLVDANAWNRTSDGGYVGKGCCVCLSTVNGGVIERVHAANGMLHGIDVMASVYLDNGDITAQPAGPSLDVKVLDCQATNTRLDDGITTHNSGHIDIIGNRVFFDRDLHGEPGDTQQGIEVDEGSYHVLVQNNKSIGWTKAYQTKGHPTTKAARHVTFRDNFADQCAFAIDIDHNPDSGSPNGFDVLVDGLRIGTLIEHSGYDDVCLWFVRGFRDVTIKNVTVINASEGKAIMTRAVTGNVLVDGIHFMEAMTIPSGVAAADHPLIHLISSLASSKFTVQNVTSDAAQPRPVVLNNNTDINLRIASINVEGSSTSLAPIHLNGVENLGLEVLGVSSTGYGGVVYDTNFSQLYANNFEQFVGRRAQMSLGSGSPESIVYAPRGTHARGYNSGRLFRKNDTAGNVNTGWVEIT